MTKTEKELQAERDDPNTKALIITPGNKNAFISEQVTFNFPLEIPSIFEEKKDFRVESHGDMLMRKVFGTMGFIAMDNPEKAEQIDEFVAMIEEHDGDKLDYLAPEFVQEQFKVGSEA